MRIRVQMMKLTTQMKTKIKLMIWYEKVVLDQDLTEEVNQ